MGNASQQSQGNKNIGYYDLYGRGLTEYPSDGEGLDLFGYHWAKEQNFLHVPGSNIVAALRVTRQKSCVWSPENDQYKVEELYINPNVAQKMSDREEAYLDSLCGKTLGIPCPIKLYEGDNRPTRSEFDNQSRFFLANRAKREDNIWGNVDKENKNFMDAIKKGYVKPK